MSKNDNSDLLQKLADIQADIFTNIDHILACLEPFFCSENQEVYLDLMNNIERIKKSSLLLKDETTKLLTKPQILPECLEKIRHDLRNPVNAMQGYAEMSLEDFQEKKIEALSTKLEEVLETVRKIVRLVDEIRISGASTTTLTDIHLNAPISETDASIAHGAISAEDLKSVEYKIFKEQFTILIVDDIEENCRILERYLNRIEYKNIIIANDGIHALKILNENKIDLILLDIDMPKMTGIEVLHRVKNQLAQHHFMIIMITGSDTIENAIKSIKLGAEDILPKPFNADILRVRIGACFEKRWFINKENIYLERIESERKRYRSLLQAIFPPTVVKELTETNTVSTREYKDVAILFADVVGFTTYCDIHPVSEIIENVQKFADICEVAAERYNIQKIKTIGDGFLAIGGMLSTHENAVLDCILCANEILQQSATLPAQWKIRAGIDYGVVIGGIVGHRQYLFDVWSDAVNTASRIQAFSPPGKIALSKTAWDQVKNVCSGKSVGMHAFKGKQKEMEVFIYEPK